MLHVSLGNHTFLNLWKKAIQSAIDTPFEQEAMMYIQYGLCFNEFGQSPLTMQINQNLQSDIEAMMKILLLQPERDYFVYLQNHFFKLIEMKSQTFLKFLDKCSSTTVLTDQKMIWTAKGNNDYSSARTKFIND